MVDVFISYARANRDTVCRLAEAIGRLGYVVWWDEELPAHLSYGEVITQKIAGGQGDFGDLVRGIGRIRMGARRGRHGRNRRLIQASIDDCVPPLPFNQIQFAAIADWSGAEDHPGWRKVRASLAALCGEAPAETALASFRTPVVAGREFLPRPRSRRARRGPWPRRADLNRIALIAITASVMILLTVGGLVLVKGPPQCAGHGSFRPPRRPKPPMRRPRSSLRRRLSPSKPRGPIISPKAWKPSHGGLRRERG